MIQGQRMMAAPSMIQVQTLPLLVGGQVTRVSDADTGHELAACAVINYEIQSNLECGWRIDVIVLLADREWNLVVDSKTPEPPSKLLEKWRLTTMSTRKRGIHMSPS